MRRPADIRTLVPPCAADLEKRIDDAIDTAGVLGVWPAKVALKDEPLGIVTDVLRRYRCEGWRLNRVSDQRDGDFVQIEAP